MKRFLMASAALTMTAGLAAAQTAPELDGLVNVNIQDVLQDIAVDLNIEETNIPVTLQVPILVAANVCDVSVNVLSLQNDGGDATCTAVTGSQELTQIVQQEMAAGGSTGGTEDTAESGDADSPEEDTADADDGSSTDDAASNEDDSGTEDTAEADEGTDDTTTSATGSQNSAKDCAPGQSADAKAAAPGQQEGDGKAAAPGQRKKVEDC
jgi:hypothetical protein